MLLALWLAALSAVPSASLPLRPMDAPSPVKSRDCPNARTHHAEDEPSGLRVRRLDQLPPGRLELAVLREVDNCPIPAVLREGIGGNIESGGEQANRR
jgi:hypothetical protein